MNFQLIFEATKLIFILSTGHDKLIIDLKWK